MFGQAPELGQLVEMTQGAGVHVLPITNVTDCVAQFPVRPCPSQALRVYVVVDEIVSVIVLVVELLESVPSKP